MGMPSSSLASARRTCLLSAIDTCLRPSNVRALGPLSVPGLHVRVYSEKGVSIDLAGGEARGPNVVIGWLVERFNLLILSAFEGRVALRQLSTHPTIELD